MKKIIILSFLIAITFLSAQEKTIKEFRKDFEKAIDTEFTEEQLKYIIQGLSSYFNTTY
ncbi:hypothetical protein [Chryseobacterium soli]|uniref:hypothetical protein n=1 Tax=Chryseobacterium soli TaxID=445961 RepID=UPI000AD2DD61|nr:hypothetical protein [Chryseobacterium soli]